MNGQPSVEHPFLRLMDLLGRRWALRILHELHQAPLGFRALASRCGGMSSSVLSARLAELRSAGIIKEANGHPYMLTDRGRELAAILVQLSDWAVRCHSTGHEDTLVRPAGASNSGRADRFAVEAEE